MLVSSLDQLMKKLPRRISLVAETAAVLRNEIESGRWKTFLPGERELCSRLRVSRPTLRAALEILHKEGRLIVAHGRSTQICRTKNFVSTGDATNRVGLLTPIPLHQMPPFVMFWIDELRERLAENGLELHVQINSNSQSPRPEKILKRLVAENPSAVWLLFLSTEPMQRWFAEHNFPCVIAGSCFPGTQFPSVDIDYRAASQHAARLLAAKGHQRIAVLLPDTKTAGDQASETGFLEGANEQVRARAVRHNETIKGICEKLDGLLKGDQPTTALLVARSANALTALTYLQRRGLRFPQDMALISRDDDDFLNSVVPKITRYACDPKMFARKISKLVLQLAREGSAPKRQILLMPDLVRGETV